MKQLLFISMLSTVFSTFMFAGFFNEEGARDKAEYAENKRLCELFTSKVQQYKPHIRNDILAKATLASYEYRASIFCEKEKEFTSNKEI